jgi:hypothetical protein
MKTFGPNERSWKLERLEREREFDSKRWGGAEADDVAAMGFWLILQTR